MDRLLMPSIKSRRTSPTGDERHSERWSGPTADSLKESQLAAGPGAFTSHRTSPTTRMETASLQGAARGVRLAKRLAASLGEDRQAGQTHSVSVAGSAGFRCSASSGP